MLHDCYCEKVLTLPCRAAHSLWKKRKERKKKEALAYWQAKLLDAIPPRVKSCPRSVFGMTSQRVTSYCESGSFLLRKTEMACFDDMIDSVSTSLNHSTGNQLCPKDVLCTLSLFKVHNQQN